jgi:hypothetical protein
MTDKIKKIAFHLDAMKMFSLMKGVTIRYWDDESFDFEIIPPNLSINMSMEDWAAIKNLCLSSAQAHDERMPDLLAMFERIENRERNE